MNYFLTLVSFLILIAIAWFTFETSSRMTSVRWIPAYVARWADSEPTFRNFPPYALA